MSYDDDVNSLNVMETNAMAADNILPLSNNVNQSSTQQTQRGTKPNENWKT